MHGYCYFEASITARASSAACSIPLLAYLDMDESKELSAKTNNHSHPCQDCISGLRVYLIHITPIHLD